MGQKALDGELGSDRDTVEVSPADSRTAVEDEIVLHYLDKYMPAKGMVLDACGSNARYGIMLAERGYEVVVLDPSEESLEAAKKRVASLPEEVSDRIVAFVKGSVTDLSMFPTGNFDAVLCLCGTLSKLAERKAREMGAKEIARVCRSRGPIFVSVLSLHGTIRRILKDNPEDVRLLFPLLDSRRLPPGIANGAKVCFTPEEIVNLLSGKGIEIVEFAGLHGLSAHLNESTDLCAARPECWDVWRRVLVGTCNHPSVVGVSESLLLVGFA
jgi:SAM-dependent methyltransferase